MATQDSSAPRPGDTRRTYVSVVFSDLCDSTALADAMEAELYLALLARVRTVCREVLPLYGGTIVRMQGDGLLAVFGYPQASEDVGRRATQAALALHKAIRALHVNSLGAPASGLAMHSGIHSGLVLLDEGDMERGRFELVGDVPNVASRLSTQARRDEILVSEGTLGPAASFFKLGDRQLLTLRGKATQVAAYRVLGLANVNTRFEARVQRGLAPFVGRQVELDGLSRALEEARTGKVVTVALSAAPGVGKTRLIEEFLARPHRARVHRGDCESYLSAEPLQPWLQMLRTLCGLTRGMPWTAAEAALDTTMAAIDPALAAHRAHWMRALSLQVPSQGRQRQEADPLITALRELFGTLARQQPVVLFIDDWQWADDASRQVLDAIRSLAGLPILVLLSTRGFAEGDARLQGIEVLPLAPFSDNDAALTITQLLPGSDPFVAAEIRRYAGGNPLFIEELCHSAAAESATGQLGHLPATAAWLESLIESRLARLAPAHAELVRVAAVVGTVIPCWLLEQLTGRTESDPLLRDLAEQDFIFPGAEPGTLRFKHGITRDAVYEAVGLHHRRALHKRIAQALRDASSAPDMPDAIEALAYHYHAADEPAETARFAELAGDKAVASSALDRAQSHYAAALAALDELPPSPETVQRCNSIVQRLGIACVFDPSRDQLPMFHRAVARATDHADPLATAQAEFWLGYIHYALGASRLAITHCERALRAARMPRQAASGEDAFVIQIKATLGQARAAACDYGPALALLDEAIDVKRKYRTGARPAVGSAYSLACKAAVLGDRGAFIDAHRCFDEALDAVRGAGHEVEGSVRCLRSLVLQWQGRWHEAEASADDGARIGERVKSLYVYAMGHALSAYARWKRAGDAHQLQAITDATGWLEARDKGLFTSLNHGWLAEMLAEAGDVTRARGHAAAALHRARQHDRLGEAMACRAMARIAAKAGHSLAMHRYLRRAMRSAAARGSAHEEATTQLCAAELHAARGDVDAVRHPLAAAVATFRQLEMAWHLGCAGQLAGADLPPPLSAHIKLSPP